MRNLLLFFILSFSAMAEVCLEGRTSKWAADGSFVGPYEVCYIKVSNVDAGSLLKGMVVIADPTEESPHEIATSTTAGAAPLCVLMENCSNGKKCKCQTYGYNESVLLDSKTGATAGFTAFISEASAGYVSDETKLNTVASDIPVGTFLETSNDDTGIGVKVFLKLR